MSEPGATLDAARAARKKAAVHAQQLTYRAIRRGRLRPAPCAVCGSTQVDAHHDDYSKPLDVMWLCRRHHLFRHRTRRMAGAELPHKHAERGATVNDALVFAREEAGLTQVDLAEFAAVPLESIRRLEQGTIPSGRWQEDVARLARELHVDPRDIMPADAHDCAIPSELPCDDHALQSVVAAEDAGSEAKLAEVSSAIAAAMSSLTVREREVVKLRYGLGDGYTYTLEEVGRKFKVTRERVRQIEGKALRKLQQPWVSRELAPLCTEASKK